MQELKQLRIKTNCTSCINKCCSQPYDWVYLTRLEIVQLERASGLTEDEFVSSRRNRNTGHVFKALNLSCRFLDAKSGECMVYEDRPLICQLFPFYPEPLTGNATLLPAQCGTNIEIVPLDAKDGWCLADFEKNAILWLADLWSEAVKS